jgi:hypothetical protein
MDADAFQTLILKCRSLNQLIVEKISPFLPTPIDWSSSSTLITPDISAAQRTLVLTHAFLSAASLKIHTLFVASGYEASQPLCITAAQHILSSIGDMGLPDFHRQSTAIGGLCALACQTLATAYHAEVSRSESESDFAVRLMNSLTGGIAVMSVLGVDCPFMSMSFLVLPGVD